MSEVGNPHPLSSVYSVLAPGNGRLPVARHFLSHTETLPRCLGSSTSRHISPRTAPSQAVLVTLLTSDTCPRPSRVDPSSPRWVVQTLLMGGAISQWGRCLHVSGSSSPSSPSSHFLALMLQMGCPNVGETCGPGQALTTSLWALGAAPTLMQVPARLPQKERVPPFHSL